MKRLSVEICIQSLHSHTNMLHVLQMLQASMTVCEVDDSSGLQNYNPFTSPHFPSHLLPLSPALKRALK